MIRDRFGAGFTTFQEARWEKTPVTHQNRRQRPGNQQSVSCRQHRLRTSPRGPCGRAPACIRGHVLPPGATRRYCSQANSVHHLFVLAQVISWDT